MWVLKISNCRKNDYFNHKIHPDLHLDAPMLLDRQWARGNHTFSHTCKFSVKSSKLRACNGHPT